MSNARKTNPVVKYLNTFGTKTLKRSSTAARESLVCNRSGRVLRSIEWSLKIAALSFLENSTNAMQSAFAAMVDLVKMILTATVHHGNSLRVQPPNVILAYLAKVTTAYALTIL